MGNLHNIAEEYARMALAEACEEWPRGSDADEWDLRESAETFLHETVDGCHEVIYTHAAWELVAGDMGGVCEDAADEMGVDLAATVAERGLSGLVSLLAYCGIHRTACEYLTDLLAEEVAARDEVTA